MFMLFHMPTALKRKLRSPDFVLHRRSESGLCRVYEGMLTSMAGKLIHTFKGHYCVSK